MTSGRPEPGSHPGQAPPLPGTARPLPPPSIVPLAGLPVVCAVLVLLVTAIAGMLEFVFVLDHTPGLLLVVLSLMLLVFAVDIPLLLAFSVARYQRADPTGAGEHMP